MKSLMLAEIGVIVNLVLWPSYEDLSAIKCFLSVENTLPTNKDVENKENYCCKINLMPVFYVPATTLQVSC